MHSKIYQMSLEPIKAEDYVTPGCFYDDSSDFADYIGDEVNDSERHYYIELLARIFKGILEVDGESLVFKGLGDFRKKWYEHICDLSKELIKVDVKDAHLALYKIRTATQRTHLDVFSRFFIEDYTGYAAPASEFIDFLDDLKEGDHIYIGSIIDFHW